MTKFFFNPAKQIQLNQEKNLTMIVGLPLNEYKLSIRGIVHWI